MILDVHLSYLPFGHGFPTMHCTIISRRLYLMRLKSANIAALAFCISIVELHNVTKPLRLMCLLISFFVDDTQKLFVFMLPVAEFWIVVQVSEAATRCNLLGSYWLQVDSEELRLKDVQKHNVVQEWPYKLLRRYGADKVNHQHTRKTCGFASCLRLRSA